MTEEYVLLVKKLNSRKITLRENESASLGTPDTRADSLLFFGREGGTSHSVSVSGVLEAQIFPRVCL